MHLHSNMHKTYFELLKGTLPKQRERERGEKKGGRERGGSYSASTDTNFMTAMSRHSKHVLYHQLFSLQYIKHTHCLLSQKQRFQLKCKTCHCYYQLRLISQFVPFFHFHARSTQLCLETGQKQPLTAHRHGHLKRTSGHCRS